MNKIRTPKNFLTTCIIVLEEKILYHLHNLFNVCSLYSGEKEGFPYFTYRSLADFLNTFPFQNFTHSINLVYYNCYNTIIHFTYYTLTAYRKLNLFLLIIPKRIEYKKIPNALIKLSNNL